MPRQKFRSKYGNKKNNKHGGGRFGNSKTFKKSNKSNKVIDKVGRKYKFMKQNQESEDALRRQQQLEERYKERNAGSNSMTNDDAESSSDEENEQGATLDDLIATFKDQKHSVDNAIESAESDSMDDSIDMEPGDDDVFPEKFEEQSQPRGRKYRSSEEENSDSNENQSDSDDLPEDTEQILLRPEEYENDKQQFDGKFRFGIELIHWTFVSFFFSFVE